MLSVAHLLMGSLSPGLQLESESLMVSPCALSLKAEKSMGLTGVADTLQVAGPTAGVF